jgi:hypothetical protein
LGTKAFSDPKISKSKVAGDKSSVGSTTVQAAGKVLILVQGSPGAAGLERQGQLLELLLNFLQLELVGLLLGSQSDLATEDLVDAAEEGCGHG